MVCSWRRLIAVFPFLGHFVAGLWGILIIWSVLVGEGLFYVDCHLLMLGSLTFVNGMDDMGKHE